LLGFDLMMIFAAARAKTRSLLFFSKAVIEPLRWLIYT